MNQIVLNHLKEYEGLSQTEQIDKLADELEAEGIDGVIAKRQKNKNGDIAYFIGEGYVVAVVPYPNKESFGCVLLDYSIYDKYLKDRKGSLSLILRNNKDYKVRLSYEGEQIDLHRVIMTQTVYDFRSYIYIDHKFISPLINTLEALRPGNAFVNKRHSKTCLRSSLEMVKEGKFSPEFLYDPSMDFTDTWYAYVLHKMLGIGTWEDIREYNIDYIKRNKVDDANWYSDLSVWIKTYMSQEFANESWYKAITAF